MANVLYLRAPDSSANLGYDTDLVSFLTGLGHTVTSQSSITAGDEAGIDLVIWGQHFTGFTGPVEVALVHSWHSSGIPLICFGSSILNHFDELNLVSPPYSSSASVTIKKYLVNYDLFMATALGEPISNSVNVVLRGSPIQIAGGTFHYLRTTPRATGSGSPTYVVTYSGATWHEFEFYPIGSTYPPGAFRGHGAVGFDENFIGEDSNPLGAKLVWIAGSAASGAVPASSGYKDVIEYAINWAIDSFAGYLASGGLALGGAADTSPGLRYPSGGLRLHGTATYFRSEPGQELGDYEVTEGGLQLSGRAITSVFVGTGFFPNERWTEIEDDAPFLFNRLKVQRNPLGSVDSGPEVWGDLLEGNGVVRWNFLWDYETEVCSVNGEPLFTLSEIRKIDGTVDDRGYPLVVYQNFDDEIYVFEWVHALQDFQHRKVANGVQPFICFYGTRINSVGEPVLVYLSGDTLVERRGSEGFSVPYSTSLVVPTDLTVILEGLGQTPSDKLQFKVRIKYER